MRLIYFAAKGEHAIPLFVDVNILPVDVFHYKSISNLTHFFKLIHTATSLTMFTINYTAINKP